MCSQLRAKTQKRPQQSLLKESPDLSSGKLGTKALNTKLATRRRARPERNPSGLLKRAKEIASKQETNSPHFVAACSRRLFICRSAIIPPETVSVCRLFDDIYRTRIYRYVVGRHESS